MEFSQENQGITSTRLDIRSCAQPLVQDPDVHTTVRQRIREARKAEVRVKVSASAEAQQKKASSSPIGKRNATNNVGQVLDNAEPAITRLIQGDFYNHKGSRAGELLRSSQGMKPRQNNALIIPHATTVATNTEADTTCTKGLHKDGRHHHHCHHGHRSKDKSVGTDPMPRPRTAVAASSSSFKNPTLSSQTKNYHRTVERMETEQRRQEAMDEQGPVVMTQHQGVAYTPHRGVANGATIVNSNSSNANNINAGGRKCKDPYAEVLGLVNSKHNPGDAAVINESELRLIKSTLLKARPQSAAVQRGKNPVQSRQIFF